MFSRQNNDDGQAGRLQPGRADATRDTVTRHGTDTARVEHNISQPTAQGWDGYQWVGALTIAAVIAGAVGTYWRFDHDRNKVSYDLAAGTLDESAFTLGSKAKFNPEDSPYVTTQRTCLHTMPRQSSMLPICLEQGQPFTATPLTSDLMRKINATRAANIGKNGDGQSPWEANPKDWVVVHVTYTAGEHTLLVPAKDVQPVAPSAASRATGGTQAFVRRQALPNPTHG